MKKPTIIVEEYLHSPFIEKENNPIPDFVLKNGADIPIFSASALEEVQEFHNVAKELMQTEPVIVFWGLSGILMNKYSVVTDEIHLKNPETTETKVRLIKADQMVNLYRESSFEVALERLGGLQKLSKIEFATALGILEGRIKPPEDEYEEPEEAEFDEDCTPECRIGDHKCGK